MYGFYNNWTMIKYVKKLLLPKSQFMYCPDEGTVQVNPIKQLYQQNTVLSSAVANELSLFAIKTVFINYYSC